MAGGLLLLAALVPLGGCSSIPDDLDPRSWFGDKADASSGTSSAGASSPITSSVDASQPFPNLSSVPEPPRPTLDPGQRLALMRGLESDRRTGGRQDAGIRQEMSTIPTQVEDYGAVRTPDSAAPAPDAGRREPAAAPLPPPVEPAPAVPSAARSVPAPDIVAVPPAAPQAGVRYAIPPRPPILPPEPLSAQPGGYVSSELHDEVGPAAIQLAAAEAFFAASDADPASGGAILMSEAGRPSWVSKSSVSAQVALLTFPNGAAQLGAAQMERLRAVVALRDRIGGRLWVVGHASQRTPEMAVVRHKLVNYGLSVDRAYQVAEALGRLGVSHHDIAVSARADWDPEAAEAMPSGEAQNRRVEIYLEY